MSDSEDRKGAGGALREAVIAALVTLALCIPIILYRTDSDPNDGTLQLTLRPIAVLVFMALAFFGRLLVLTFNLRPARPKAVPSVAPPTGFRAFVGQVIAPLGLAFLIFYPAIVVWWLGAGGAQPGNMADLQPLDLQPPLEQSEAVPAQGGAVDLQPGAVAVGEHDVADRGVARKRALDGADGDLGGAGGEGARDQAGEKSLILFRGFSGRGEDERGEGEAAHQKDWPMPA